MLSAMPGWHYQRDLIGKLCQLVGVVRVMSLLRMSEIASGRSFKSNNLKELKLRDSIQAENDPLENLWIRPELPSFRVYWYMLNVVLYHS